VGAGLTTSDFEFEPIFNLAIVAMAFSPRLLAVLNEACAFLKNLGTRAVIVTVGEDTPDMRAKMETAIQNSAFAHYPHTILVRSGQPADVLLQTADEFKADLIVAGALSKEGRVKYVMGSTARRLARQAPCSVLLYTDPQIQPKSISNMHCVVEYGRRAQSAVKMTARLAAIIDVKNLYFSHTFRVPGLLEQKKENPDSKKIIRAYQREHQRLNRHLMKYDFYGHSFQTQCLFEHNKSVTLNYTREIAADLFVLPASRDGSNLWGRLFRSDQELSLQDLPCTTLLIR
jgi:nucleotide-binding universal stress UspA family protein